MTPIENPITYESLLRTLESMARVQEDILTRLIRLEGQSLSERVYRLEAR